MGAVIGGPVAQGNATYEHVQSVAATQWVINHNLGFRPDVVVLDSASREIEVEVYHPTVNQTIIELNEARTGRARLT